MRTACAHCKHLRDSSHIYLPVQALNQQRLNTIFSCAAHLPGPFSLLRRGQSDRVNFTTAHLNILCDFDVFSSVIIHYLLYHVSRPSLELIRLTIQQISSFAFNLHVESPHTTRRFIDEGIKVPWSSYRHQIHDVDIGVYKCFRSILR